VGENKNKKDQGPHSTMSWPFMSKAFFTTKRGKKGVDIDN